MHIKQLVALLGVIGCLIAGEASAFSITEVQEDIQDLVSKLQGARAPLADCVVPAAPLALGSHNAEVKKLQSWLGQHGYRVVPTGSESEYFGPLTHFALLRFQSDAGIRPVSGIYGPLTKAAITERCAIELAAQTGARISLADTNPDGGLIAARSSHIEVLTFDVAGKTTLDSLTIHYLGDAEAIGFDELYLYEGDVRLTPGREIDSKTMTATFSDLALTIDGSRTLSVFANASAANDFSLGSIEIRSASSVVAQGTVTGSFPVTSSEFRRSPNKASSLSVLKNNALPEVTVGERGVRIADFEIISEVRQEAALHAITLTVDGVEKADVSNFSLRHNDVEIASAAALSGKKHVVLRLNQAMKLQTETPLKLALFADIGLGVAAGTNLEVYIDSPVDVDASYASGERLAVLSAKYNNSARNGSDASWVTIKGGTVTYAFRGPTVGHYAVKQNDVELFRFDVASEHLVEMRKLRIALVAGGADAANQTLLTPGGLCRLADANYRDVKLVDALSGEILGYGQDTACVLGEHDASRILSFTGNWLVSAGTTRTVKVLADIADFKPAEGETIRAALMTFEREDIRDLTDGVWLNANKVVPEGTIWGAAHRVYRDESAASLGRSLAAAPSVEVLP